MILLVVYPHEKYWTNTFHGTSRSVIQWYLRQILGEPNRTVDQLSKIKLYETQQLPHTTPSAGLTGNY